MLRACFRLSVAIAFGCVSCGSSNPPPANNNGASQNGAQTRQQTSNFVPECMERFGFAAATCSCVQREVEGPSQNSSPSAGRPLVDENAQMTQAFSRCLSEDDWSKIWWRGCQDNHISRAMCQCRWNFFRGKYQSAQMLDTTLVNSSPYQAFMDGVKTQCQQAAYEGFMSGCTEKKPGYKAFCECAYKRLREQFSVDEITDDEFQKTPRGKDGMQWAVKQCAAKVPHESTPGEQSL